MSRINRDRTRALLSTVPLKRLESL
jgi:hypothetical protein